MMTNEANGAIKCQGNRFNPYAAVPIALVQRMVNIAGLGPGDAVVSVGDSGGTVEAAVADAGAQIIFAMALAKSGRRGASASHPYAKADAVIWTADDQHQPELDEALAVIRHTLRPGGRLTVWAAPDGCRNGPAFARRLQRRIGAAGFTSIIGGSIPTAGGEAVVATGVYIAGIHGFDCQPAIHKGLRQ